MNFSSWKNTRINNQTICKHLKENKEISNFQYEFVKTKLYQNNLISFCERANVDRKETADVTHNF